ncbi:NAD(P)H-dependent oxidoreductase [Microvirga arsenatis]|uniref:FMN reductase n=1 Tax=Microvirga arsenatis TaxID=2692265 RepID=A0ABW9Z4U9_9HYPH|nr:NAD(P)H-dependent oxidoreductase [Microvirga arsenatis]NBJ12851.1 FMN reductase [Microvirga arsenatis]NBJ26710.1 FMN reductase [Microvirga arsenatis]
MSRPSVVIFCGNLRRPSRSRVLAEALGAEVGRRVPVDLKVYDVLDAGPGFGSALTRSDLPLPAARIIDGIESADALIVGTPVYKGAYTGLFKHLIDFVDPGRLAGKPVALTATGGGLRHALMVEHALRPLFGFFAALTVPTAVYASEADFTASGDGVRQILTDACILARLAGAADELSRLIPKRMGVTEAVARPAQAVR